MKVYVKTVNRIKSNFIILDIYIMFRNLIKTKETTLENISLKKSHVDKLNQEFRQKYDEIKKNHYLLQLEINQS